MAVSILGAAAFVPINGKVLSSAAAAALLPGPSFLVAVEGQYFNPYFLDIYSFGFTFDYYADEYEWQQNDGSGWVTFGDSTDFFQIGPEQPYGPMSFRVRAKVSGVWTDWSPVQSLGVTWQPYGHMQSEGCDAYEYFCCTTFADGAGGSFTSCGAPNSYGTFSPQNWAISDQNFLVDGEPTSSGAQLIWPPIPVDEYGYTWWGGTADTRKYVLTGPSGDINVPWTSTTYFMPLPSGTTSTVTIKAVSFGGETGGGVTLSITTPSAVTAPNAPTSLSGTAGNGQVSLSWTAPASNGGAAITDYAVQYSSNSGSTWATFSDGASTATSATVTGLTNGTAYTFRVAAVNSVGTGAYSSASASVTPAAPFSGSAVILTSGTSYTVPAGATSMKAWAVGSGGTGDGWYSFSGNAGGCAYKTWSVSGGQSVAYTRSDNGNSTVTFGGVTITGNAAPRNSRSTTASGFSGGDGGAAGGVFTYNDPVMRGGAVGGNGSVASSCNRWRATDVSGLFAAVALAGGSTTESCNATAAFGSGGVSGKFVSPYAAGIGGGGVTANEYTRTAAAAPGVGAVVLKFT